MSVWQRFRDRFPDADLSFFKQKNFFGSEQNVLFEDPSGLESAVFTEAGALRSSIYFSPGMKKALGMSGGFPLELTLKSGSGGGAGVFQFPRFLASAALRSLSVPPSPNRRFSLLQMKASKSLSETYSKRHRLSIRQVLRVVIGSVDLT